ncbi:heme A synthase [Deinococcus metallilatus]|uniref:Cytochrome c oxidase assembly protein subunit 15 n=1 Tax=Deinococcus metallilatus TaxID=1211322 RepID=A0AAJ5F523_9DEIO|nr:COX15/CtaA family protein [Deinococcus metallilatus]MBB5295592.1 cytochrome c oxidase assembly protein subunit 15 [Deinococcus metallilatus]QBY07898.1 heme A synthase [Deinococcus metallilatus]RXJ12791.1 heme A synthase [Deinococcus metallilatus]TLK27287.1 heme A synthase [Deinococcus metallilatus]GMA16271.1 heme A synthase [Deinococcus metallilatus]
MSSALTVPRSRAGAWLPRLAWAALAYNVLVILWGAVVRLTGAGAGCGDHWPLCNGVVVPQSPQLHTVIEFSHRLTSGASGLLALGLIALAFATTRRGHPARLGAVLTFLLILTEGLVGGVQVLLGLTADSTDPARGFVQGVHLANTFLLLGALLLTALWASGRPALRLRGQGRTLGWIALGLVLALLVGLAGTVTALGDLLFTPAAGTPIDTVRRDFGTTAGLIENLRVIHPMLAILTSAYLIWLVGALRRLRPAPEVTRWGMVLLGVIGAQVLAGFVNVALRAPAWMQLTHLLLACIMWLVTVLLSYEALTAPRRARPLTPQSVAA